MPKVQLPADPGSLSAARQFVSGYLESQGLPAEWGTLLVSELATNVLRYAGTPFHVSVSVDEEKVRLEVWDGAPDLAVAPRMATRDGGYGLRLVEKLARAWGVEPQGKGKVVWVELDRANLSSGPPADGG